MLELFANADILEYSKSAGSSAIMIIMIFVLLLMLNRSQKKYLETIDKYSILIEKQIIASTELTTVVKNQNQIIKDIFISINK